MLDYLGCELLSMGVFLIATLVSHMGRNVKCSPFFSD